MRAAASAQPSNLFLDSLPICGEYRTPSIAIEQLCFSFSFLALKLSCLMRVGTGLRLEYVDRWVEARCEAWSDRRCCANGLDRKSKSKPPWWRHSNH